MAVPEQTPYKKYIANGSTTSFALGFKCKDKAHLIVKLNDENASVNTWMLSNDTVVFSAAPASGTKIFLQRKTPNRRTTEYKTFNNSFNPSALNEDLDTIWLRLQEEEVAKFLLNQLINMNYEDLDQKGQDIRSELINRLTEKTDQLNNQIIQQGVSQQQLQSYYQFLLNKISNISVSKNWIADLISYGDTTQKAFNDEVKEKTYSIKDAGATGGDDTAALRSAINASNRVLLNTARSIIRQIRIQKSVTLTGDTEIVQDIPNQHTLLTNYDTGTPEDLAGLMIKRQRFIGLKFGQMPVSTSDDFAALKIRNGDGAITAFNTFNGVENGLITTASSGVSGVKGKGSRDTVSLCDNVDTSRRFAFMNSQSNYTRVIGLTAHSNGDNDAETFGGVNNGGFNTGIRLVNWSIGFTMVASSVRDKVNGVSYQTGTSHTIIANSFFENSRDNTLAASVGNQPIGGRHIVSDVQIKDAGTNAIRTQYLGQSRFSGIIDTCGSRGIDGAAAESNNEHFRLVYTGGTGTVPAVGTVITQGGVTGVLVQVFKSDRLPAAVGSTMTSTGEILVKTVQGGFFGAGELTGIGATVTRAYGAEGRNRVDATVLNAAANSLRLGTDSNLVDLISADCPTSDGTISGNFNIIRLVITDNPTTSSTVFSGSNSIIQIVDNRKVSATGVFYITGSNNHVIGNTKARVFIPGNGNYVDIIADRITVDGNNNSIGGQVRTFDGSGTGNDFSRIKGAVYRGTVTLTTDASGVVSIPHGLIKAASNISVDIVSDAELLSTTIVNPAATSTTSTVKIWAATGVPAADKSVTLNYIASV